MGAFADLRHELASLGTAYPRFVSRRVPRLPAGEIPVFVFHTIDPALFELQLRFLRENAYRTVGLDEYSSIVTGRTAARGGEVLLTIDDARSSAWRYGHPLLQEHGCRAALFVIAGWTGGETAELRPNLADVHRGAIGLDALRALDPADATLCTWSELRAMQGSGTVDIGSHTWLHRRVFTGHRLSGFVGPDSRLAPFHAAFSPYLTPGSDPHERALQEFFGLPLFEAHSVMEAVPAWRLAGGLMDECRAAYRELTSAGAPDWRRRLTRRFASRFTPQAFAVGSADEACREIESEVALARDTFVQQLGRAEAGAALCLPFAAGTDAAIDVARRQGVKCCFWGVRAGQRGNRIGDDPMYLVRIKNDFLWRLPGRGRRSLLRIYSDKLTRRLRGESPY